MAKLVLSVIRGTYAVVRLRAGSQPPNWLWSSNFYSLTKTNEELSIVCEQNKVPSEILSTTDNHSNGDDDQDNNNNNNNVLCESEWGLFKVEGPLDFGLTGIMSRLTAPLAKAGISIFAVSTYDTDYILVKQNRVFDAGYAWILEGHVVKGLPPTRVPVDGAVPAIEFETDDTIQQVVDLLRGKPSAKETFGAALVSGWVPPETVQAAYNNKFVPAVQKCFQESDYTKSPEDDDDDSIPNVYIYPSQSLHVTVATLHFFHQPIRDESFKDVLQKEWTGLVQAASLREEWPKQPLQLSLDSAQIGQKAGILLWNELTGGLDGMRICINAELKNRQQQLMRAGIDTDAVRIPSIIHSTFLRFHNMPETPGPEIQAKFERHVKKELSTFFPDPVIFADAKLVCEKIPYMHIEDNDYYVFARFPFEKMIS